MSKNAFTPDGGPHRPDRVRNVSDGLKRLGEFEAAEMLANYAALLRERESAKAGVTSQMRATACDAYDKEMVGHGETANPVAMRAALEAVVPMLASVRVPDGWSIGETKVTGAQEIGVWLCDGKSLQVIHPGDSMAANLPFYLIKAMLAAAPKPEEK